MSSVTGLMCDGCGTSEDPSGLHTVCPRCGGLLEFQYDLDFDGRRWADEAAQGRPLRFWRWHHLLPAVGPPVSLGEGDTPLVDCPTLAADLGLARLWVKNDGMAPTGSLKDRGMTLAVSSAKAHNLRAGFTYSSGNAGMSFSAYASRAGIRPVVLVEDNADEMKIAAISLLGGLVYRMGYGSHEAVFECVEAVARAGAHSFVNFVNPLRHEGMKTYAYEIAEELGWQAPDVYVAPVGTGGGIWGAWKGFQELRTLGLISRIPRMIGVQPAVCAPLAEVFRRGPVATPVGNARDSIAQSIATDAMLHGGLRPVRALHDSGGAAVSVTEKEIVEAMACLGATGISAEPSAAAAYAGLVAAQRDGLVNASERAVVVVTAGALKAPHTLAKVAPHVRGEIDTSPEAWQQLLSAAGVLP